MADVRPKDLPDTSDPTGFRLPLDGDAGTASIAFSAFAAAVAATPHPAGSVASGTIDPARLPQSLTGPVAVAGSVTATTTGYGTYPLVAKGQQPGVISWDTDQNQTAGWSLSFGTMFFRTSDPGSPAGLFNDSFSAGAGFVESARVRTTPTTVASLGFPWDAGAGSRRFVTDATSTTFAAVLSGGGSNAVPVYSDGTTWRVG